MEKKKKSLKNQVEGLQGQYEIFETNFILIQILVFSFFTYKILFLLKIEGSLINSVYGHLTDFFFSEWLIVNSKRRY